MDKDGKETKEAEAPYKITFPPTKSPQTLVAQSYIEPRSSPFPFAKIKRNKVPFTPAQIEAIRSGKEFDQIFWSTNSDLELEDSESSS